MSSDAEQFVERVKAADGDGLIDGDPWKYEARCEREAKERALEEVARLRDSNISLHNQSTSLRQALEVESRYSSEAKAIIESERAVMAARGEAVAKMRASLGEDVDLEKEMGSAAARHRAEVVKLNAEAIEREATIQDLEEKFHRSLEERDAMEQRHRAELASLKESAAHVEPLLARIAEAERKLNRGLTLGLDEQRRADRLQVGLDMANKARAELEEILSAWDETFDVGRVWAPPAAYDEDGEAIERDRGDWTVEEWRSAIRACMELVRKGEATAREHHHQAASMFHLASREASSAKEEARELRAVVKMMRRWMAEEAVEREALRAKVEAFETQASNVPCRG